MNRVSRALIALVATMALVSSGIVEARTHRSLTEDAALNLLLSTLKRDNVYAKRISLDCVTFSTDEITRTYFEFALREKHNAKCGGDPDTSPVVDRYRVHRGYKTIDWFDVVNDNWQPYNPAKIR